MSRDSLDERCAALFAAGRLEPAPEATRQRIAVALRARSAHAVASNAPGWKRPVVGVALAAAAALLVVATSGLIHRDGEPVLISAEAPAELNANERAADNRTLIPVPTPPAPSASSPSIDVEREPKRETKPEPASLDEELASMQRARAALGRGNAPAALAELDRFGQRPGWRQLAVEASLLRIEVLARAGRADESRNLARRFIAQHPNNPLVDRARTFATPPSPSSARGLPQEKPHE